MKNKLKGFVFILLLCFVKLAHSAEISIEPKDATTFDTWLPQDGNTVDLLVTVSDYDDSDGEIQFRFTEVSNWPGTCMNDRLYRTSGTDANGNPISKQDLCLYGQSKDVFLSVANARSGTALSVRKLQLTWEVQADGTTEARFSWTSDADIPVGGFTIGVTVTCENYGAFGTLQARLYKKKFVFGVDETATILRKSRRGSLIWVSRNAETSTASWVPK